MLHQNYSSVYHFNVKTRRYNALLKLLQAPLVFVNLVFKLLNYTTLTHNLSLTKYENLIKFYYLDLNTWSFYRNLLINNKGALLNNLDLSYLHLNVSNHIIYLDVKTPKVWNCNKITSSYLYTTPVTIIPFNFKKQTFNKITIVILLTLLKLYTPFIRVTNFTQAFVFIPLHLNFFTFYSAFYMRVYNF